MGALMASCVAGLAAGHARFAAHAAAVLLAVAGVGQISLGAPPAGEVPGNAPGVGAAGTARGVMAPGAAESFPPIEADLPRDRFALYIAINRYPRIENQDLSGSVNDMSVLRGLMTERFGFRRSAMITDAAATRAGIAAAMRELVDQVAAARERTAGTITALICYAGHGSHVIDQPVGQPGHDEPDGRDETWVPYDSSFSGENDIRDDEIASAWSALASSGAQVILFSDSCHSGTVHRGHSEFRSRSIDRPMPGPGPSDELFAGFAAQVPAAAAAARQGRAGLLDGEPLPGFVAYTAARDSQKAFEYQDDDGRPCGRFTFALRKVLATMGPNTTYQELFQKLAIEFDRTWTDRMQTPQFEASPAKRQERFLEGGFAPAHAAVVPRSRSGATLELTMGSVHGVGRDSTFELYADLDDLAARRNMITTATVESIEALKCRVRLSGDAVVPASAKARLDAVRLGDFTVFLDAGLAPEVRERLEAMASSGHLTLAADAAASCAVVMQDAQPGRVGIYSPAAMPMRGAVAPGSPGAAGSPAAAGTAGSTAHGVPGPPEPMRVIHFESPSQAAERVAENLRYLARCRRLMALEHGEEFLRAEVVMEGRGGPSIPASAGDSEPDEGMPRLRAGEAFRLRLRNLSSVPMYVTVIAPDRSEHLAVLFPQIGDPMEPVPPQGELMTPAFDAAIFDEGAAAATGFERTQMKLIAASERMDFEPLMVPPETGAPPVQTRGGPVAGSELIELMQEAMESGPRTRGVGLRAGGLTWATGMIVIDVEPAE
jgi:hypothetical protein